MIIDTHFNFLSDSGGKDPDSYSPTLKKYHQALWSKLTPNGTVFDLNHTQLGSGYLYHKSDMGEFFLGSDAITHSYKHHKRKELVTNQIPEEVDELYNAGCTIGAYIVFPSNRVEGKHTINQARGVNRLIDDRFDLTLECIRLYYLGTRSPLYDALNRYKEFFDLFKDFLGYVSFFLLDDLVDNDGNIKFYLPFDNFTKPPKFVDVGEYLQYKEGVMSFIESRNNRIRQNAVNFDLI